MLLAVLSAAGLYHYEDLFPGLIASGWEGLYDGKAMAGLIWLLAGGIAYTVGAILYGLGRKHRYMHSVFHLFVLAGSILHFVCIFAYII